MAVPRRNHTVTLMNNGRVLIAGGRGEDSTAYNVAEIYDPVNDYSASVSANMKMRRTCHTADLLTNGNVLLAGGDDTAFAYDGKATLEVFDINSGEFKFVENATLSLPGSGSQASWRGREQMKSFCMYDGRVIYAGGRSVDVINGIMRALQRLSVPTFPMYRAMKPYEPAHLLLAPLH
jgi:hypothetical protein